MVSTRCLKCGDVVEGFVQMCSNCTAEKRAADDAARQQAVETSTMKCPWCGASMLRTEQRCPTCFREWQDYRQPIVGMGGVQRGDFWVRLVAWFIDSIITSFVTVPLSLVLPPAPSILASFAVGIVYLVWFLSNKGATPGKMVMGLKVVDMDGNYLTPMHAVGRYFSHFVSAITLGIGYLMIFGEQHMGLHDRVSGSQVVFANTLPKPQTPELVQPA